MQFLYLMFDAEFRVLFVFRVIFYTVIWDFSELNSFSDLPLRVCVCVREISDWYVYYLKKKKGGGGDDPFKSLASVPLFR